MSNSSLSILKNFTRKLANSRYRVAIDTLIDDLKKGGFGYNTVRTKKEVVKKPQKEIVEDTIPVVEIIEEVEETKTSKSKTNTRKSKTKK